MQVKLGSYAFDAGGVFATPHIEYVLNAGGQFYKTKQSVEVAGWINVNGQADASQKMSALVNAVAVIGQDLIVYHDDATQSAIKLLNAPSLTGTRCSRELTFPKQEEGAIFNTQLYFSFAMEAEYPLPGSQKMLLDFQETVSTSGGGRRRILIECLNVPPQPQVPVLATTYRAIQHGSARGFVAYPDPPPCVFPRALLVNDPPAINRTTPKRLGRAYEGHLTTWRYEYASATPLIGVPNLWIS